MSSGAKRVLVTGLVAVVALAGLRLALHAWAVRSGARMARAAGVAAVVEDARIAAMRFAVVSGTPRPDACDLTGMPRLRKTIVLGEREFADESHRPGQALPAAARSLLEAERFTLEEVREMLRCTHMGADARARAYVPVHTPNALSRLLVTEGHARAEDGQAARAADSYWTALRLAITIGAVEPDSGAALTARALLGTAGLVALRPKELRTDEVASTLDELAPTLPEPARIYLHARIRIGQLGDQVATRRVVPLSAPLFASVGTAQRMKMRLARIALPAAAITAIGIAELEDLSRSAEEVVGAADPIALARAEVHEFEVAWGTWNPIVFELMPAGFRYPADLRRDQEAALKLLRAAIWLDRAHRDTGRYPDALGVDPARDPFDPKAPLRFEVLGGGSGYRIWSVGRNGRDDTGHAPPGAEPESDDLAVSAAAP